MGIIKELTVTSYQGKFTHLDGEGEFTLDGNKKFNSIAWEKEGVGRFTSFKFGPRENQRDYRILPAEESVESSEAINNAYYNTMEAFFQEIDKL